MVGLCPRCPSQLRWLLPLWGPAPPSGAIPCRRAHPARRGAEQQPGCLAPGWGGLGGVGAHLQLTGAPLAAAPTAVTHALRGNEATQPVDLL